MELLLKMLVTLIALLFIDCMHYYAVKWFLIHKSCLIPPHYSCLASWNNAIDTQYVIIIKPYNVLKQSEQHDSTAWRTTGVKCILFILRKTHLKTRNSVQGNGGSQIQMQFSLSKNNVGINRLVYQLGNVQMFHNMRKSSNSSKCHLTPLCSKQSIIVFSSTG